MKPVFRIAGILLIAVFILLPTQASGFVINTRYATITYYTRDTLKEFNSELYVRGRLRDLVRKHSTDTIEEEVRAKIDVIVEKTMIVLDMYPADLKFSMVIHPSTDGVQMEFKQMYNRSVDYIAFYSPGRNTIFFSAEDSSLRVVTHEIGHVVAENYFTISPPPKIHEVLAQYAEKHITD